MSDKKSDAEIAARTFIDTARNTAGRHNAFLAGVHWVLAEAEKRAYMMDENDMYFSAMVVGIEDLKQLIGE